jgi:cyclohexanone monooxygenase
MKKQDYKIAIIGAGPTGIAAGRELLQQGFNNFTIYDKEKAAGGTWHRQTYPGLACDVWAHSYTYSYAPNPDWTESFVGQREIEAYLQKCSRDFGLEPYLQFNRQVIAATLQADKQWLLSFSDGSTELYSVIINAMGNQHTAVFPPIAGIDEKGNDVFTGDSWHSTYWNHDVDLTDKKVLVIGSAAAAVQIIPAIADKVRELVVLQRSANWILPRNNKRYSPTVITLFKRFPFLMRAFRFFQGLLMNVVYHAVSNESRTMKVFENMALKFIEKSFTDPALRKAVTPDSRYGCKRPLVSDDYYPALNRDNVTLKHIGAKAITPEGCITADNQHLDADVIIYCTGYKVLDFDRINVCGEHGLNLAEEMAKAPEAYKGIAVPGFPNYFLAVGPNALVLSVSYFKSIEANTKNIVDLLSAMQSNNIKAIDARPELTREYNDWVIAQCKQFSWGSGACHNYYINDSGQSPFLYPATYKEFLKMRANCGLQDFRIIN